VPETAGALSSRCPIVPPRTRHLFHTNNCFLSPVMFLIIDAAHAASVSYEQLFSVARDVFDYRRSRLSPADLSEKFVFLNQALPVVNFRY
jgi:hypothetical protein